MCSYEPQSVFLCDLKIRAAEKRHKMLIFVTFCERGDRAVRQRHTESVFVVIGIYLYSPDIFPFSAVSFFIDKCGIFLQHGIEITEECAEAFIAAVEIGYYKEFYRQGLITADELDILLQLQKKKAEEKKNKKSDLSAA